MATAPVKPKPAATPAPAKPKPTATAVAKKSAGGITDKEQKELGINDDQQKKLNEKNDTTKGAALTAAQVRRTTPVAVAKAAPAVAKQVDLISNKLLPTKEGEWPTITAKEKIELINQGVSKERIAYAAKNSLKGEGTIELYKAVRDGKFTDAEFDGLSNKAKLVSTAQGIGNNIFGEFGTEEHGKVTASKQQMQVLFGLRQAPKGEALAYQAMKDGKVTDAEKKQLRRWRDIGEFEAIVGNKDAESAGRAYDMVGIREWADKKGISPKATSAENVEALHNLLAAEYERQKPTDWWGIGKEVALTAIPIPVGKFKLVGTGAKLLGKVLKGAESIVDAKTGAYLTSLTARIGERQTAQLAKELEQLNPTQRAKWLSWSLTAEPMTQTAKKGLAKELGGIARSAQPVASGGSSKVGRWWEYKDVNGKVKLVVQHTDGSVHVGTPKAGSLHRTGGIPKYADEGGFGHVGEYLLPARVAA